MTHICVSKLTIIGSDNGLSPGRRQAIIQTNAGISLIGPLGTNFSDILIGIQTCSFKKTHLKMSSAKWRSFCLGLNVLKLATNHSPVTVICVVLLGHLMHRTTNIYVFEDFVAGVKFLTNTNLIKLYASYSTLQGLLYTIDLVITELMLYITPWAHFSQWLNGFIHFFWLLVETSIFQTIAP